MSPELIARADFARKIEALQADISGPRERMAKLAGLLEGLREAIGGPPDTAWRPASPGATLSAFHHRHPRTPVKSAA